MMENEETENSDDMVEHEEEGTDEDDIADEQELEIDVKQTSSKEMEKKPKGKRGVKTVLSGRSVTLKMLVDDGILVAEDGVMSIDYLGQKFVADLLSNGKIKWEGSNKLFNSPSAWAIHCKKLVNPSKKSGCGWASVKYRGKKLDQFKTTWFRKQRPLFHSSKTGSPASPSTKKTLAAAPPPVSLSTSKTDTSTTTITSPSSESSGHAPSFSSPERSQAKQDRLISPTSSTSSRTVLNQSTSKKELAQKIKNKTPRQSKKDRKQGNQRKGSLSSSSSIPVKVQEKQDVQAQAQATKQPDVADLSSFYPSRKTKLISCPRTSVNIAELQTDSDPKTLVECLNFATLKKTQPFTVSVNTNTLMLMDLHCHLTTSEVAGYLGGHWHRDTNSIQVVQAFPVKCRFANQKNAGMVEEEIRLAMKVRGLVVVGWYHSHPTYQPDPSVQDLAAQQHYQKCLRAEKYAYDPCIGFIVSPYDPNVSSLESTVRAFWVQSGGGVSASSPGHPLPVMVNYNIQPSGLLTEDLLTEMRLICSYYKGSPDAVDFNESWISGLGVTFLDKVKASLMKKFPKDQSNRLVCFINMLLS